jgi:hypothetical protein
MEKGKVYEVYYKDDTQSRHKTLIFDSISDGLVNFVNSMTNKIEIIPLGSIIRIEGGSINGRKEQGNFKP